MFAVKALAFLILNVSLGYLLAVMVKSLLFYPSRPKYFGYYKLPLTPGLVHRSKAVLISKLNSYVSVFIRDCQDFSEQGRIYIFEMKVYAYVIDSLSEKKIMKSIPSFFEKPIKTIIAQFAFEIVRYFVRSFIPYLMDRYSLDCYLGLLDRKLEVSVLEGYYNRYFHRYLTLLFLSFFFMTGVFNMLIYILIG